MQYTLGFDIGNTSTTMGIYPENEIPPCRTFRYDTDKKIKARKLGIIISDNLQSCRREIGHDINITGVAFSSVAPEVNTSYRGMSGKLFKLEPLEINSGIKLNIKIRYDRPEELGPDRIVDAAAAHREYKKDCIIVGMGTANTFCVLLSDGTFEGGLIGPGLGITINALAEKTSKLAKVNFEKPADFIARNTIDAIKSGFFYGWTIMISGIISKIKEEYKRDFQVIFTGGYSSIVGKYIEGNNIIDPLLTMKGIKYLYDINKNP